MKLSVQPPILIGYKPGARHLSFLANYTSNIPITNRLSQFAYSAARLNSAPNNHVLEC